MRKPLSAFLALGLIGTALMGAAGASAATVAGNQCSNVVPAPGYTIFTVANPPLSPIPAAAPAPGVVTSWSVNFPPEAAVPQQMKVARLVAPPNAYQVTGETGTVNIVQGLNTFQARIPVQAGDVFGLYGSPIAIACDPVPGATLAAYPGNITTGQTQSFESEDSVAAPVSVMIEPDADNDGFGDETQDKCPQSAAAQVACPVTVVDSFALAKRNKVVVLVVTSTTTTVTVSASAKVPNVRKRARSSAQARLPKVTQVVEPGKIARFALNYPAKLRSALKGLKKGRSLALKITATAPNLAGPATTDRAQLRLKGTGR